MSALSVEEKNCRCSIDGGKNFLPPRNHDTPLPGEVIYEYHLSFINYLLFMVVIYEYHLSFIKLRAISTEV